MPRSLPASTQARSLFPVDPEALDSEPKEQEIVEGTDVWNVIPTLAPAPRKISGSEMIEIGEASYIIEQARLQGESIVMMAEMDGAVLIDEARTQAQKIRDDAKAEGYAAGLAKARADADAQYKAAFDKRCAELSAGVDSIITAIVDEREIMWKTMETEIIGFALDIARKVTKSAIEADSNIVLAVITDAMRRVSDRTSLRILVNPSEVEHVRSSRDDLMIALDGIKNLEIDPDRRVGRGGCVIETNAGSIDAKIETQFEQIEAALQA